LIGDLSSPSWLLVAMAPKKKKGVSNKEAEQEAALPFFHRCAQNKQA